MESLHQFIGFLYTNWRRSLTALVIGFSNKIYMIFLIIILYFSFSFYYFLPYKYNYFSFTALLCRRNLVSYIEGLRQFNRIPLCRLLGKIYSFADRIFLSNQQDLFFWVRFIIMVLFNIIKHFGHWLFMILYFYFDIIST